jgi:hypothetical protein
MMIINYSPATAASRFILLLEANRIYHHIYYTNVVYMMGFTD